MVNQLRSETTGSFANAVDIRLGATRPIYRVASWVPAGVALQALSSSDARRWPKKVGATASIPASYRMLCIGPAEWLAIGCESGPRVSDLAPLAVVKLTEGFACIELFGEAVGDLLTSVCALDVHLAGFAVDTCARTRLAGIAVVLDRHSSEEFACYAPRSYLNYLLAALRESARSLINVRF